MKGPSWKIDESNYLTTKRGLFGKYRVSLNGVEVSNKILWKKINIPFVLSDRRKAELLIIPSGYAAEFELRIDNQLLLSETDNKNISCLKCASSAKIGDKFCEKCGSALPNAENQLRMKKLREARNAIGIVGGLFILSGVVMFFVQRSATARMMQNLSNLQDTQLYSQLVAGKQITVGELRHQLQSQPMYILAMNFLLAAIMFGLYQYAKKSPLVSLLIAMGIYVSVQVTSAIISPMTMGQGIYVKILMIGLLTKGIRSALELRKESV